MSRYSSLLDEAIKNLNQLPGIGKKTAMRLALSLLNKEKESVESFCQSIWRMRSEIKRCVVCDNISDNDKCHICSDSYRKQNLICVVESLVDLMAIEDTGQYKGVYHILGGVISPIEGIGPEQINLDKLIQRVSTGEVDELIMAISPTIDGETTIYYISKKMQAYPVKISQIARGVAFGGELQYTDEITLARSIITRLPYGAK